MQKPSIILKDLVVKTHENTILDGISFSIFPNQHLAILGNADSGKTTLAEAIARKIHDSGTVVIDADNTTMHVRIGFVAQRYLFKNLSGISEFYYQQRFNSFDSDNAPTIFEELSKILVDSEPTNNIDSVLNALGTLHVKDASLIQLSSGEHKRFQLAKALLNKPQVLILDNPYTGLDVAVRDELNVILKNISEKGTQIVLIPGTFPIPDFITHVAFLKNKKLQFFGEKENFIPVIESLNQEKVMVRVDINEIFYQLLIIIFNLKQ